MVESLCPTMMVIVIEKSNSGQDVETKGSKAEGKSDAKGESGGRGVGLRLPPRLGETTKSGKNVKARLDFK